MRTPEIELLWWEGCPSAERALEELREAIADVGMEAEVVVTEITTDGDARAARFSGSPTILVDRVDVAGAGHADAAPLKDGEPSALTCRVYHRRDGRVSPTPDPEDLRDALRRAGAEHGGADSDGLVRAERNG
ncbi:MAG: hypothetical protein ACR2OB_13555 [Solirubrobacteraceae bacterium]